MVALFFDFIPTQNLAAGTWQRARPEESLGLPSRAGVYPPEFVYFGIPVHLIGNPYQGSLTLTLRLLGHRTKWYEEPLFWSGDHFFTIF